MFISCNQQINQVKFERNYEEEEKLTPFIIDSFHSDIDKEKDSTYIFIPIAFNLINISNNNLKYNYLVQNCNYTQNYLFINKTRHYGISYDLNMYLNKKSKDLIYYYFAFPISINEIKGEITNSKLLYNNRRDSIIVNKMHVFEAYKKKLSIVNFRVSLTSDKINKGTIDVFYCFGKNLTTIYNGDSLKIANPRYRFECK